MGAGTDYQCGWCGSNLPHLKLTCPDCKLVYDDCEDWSGPAHPTRDCIAELKRRMDVHMSDQSKPAGVCIFCFKDESNKTPWCIDNPGRGCTYGLGHEYEPTEKIVVQTPRVDMNKCSVCGVHKKNPLSQTNGCEHLYLGV